MDELNNYRAKCSLLFHYDWISIPLVYTQVVTIAVYSFFAFCVVGRQFLNPAKGYKDHRIDMYVPVFTLLQFFFYAGWLKVGELIINPFGEDDDDFETNQLIDRNIQVSMLAVDDMYQNLVPLEKDKHWAQRYFSVPYTLSTAAETLKPAFKGSTYDMRMSAEDLETYPVDEEGILRGASLPSLLDIQTLPDRDEHNGCDLSNHKDERDKLVTIEITQND
ncbi:hypothetical protein WMY93_000709 [Mugilogobius chulae]|uniref:Bestrophin homolog n=1 Tax=Mugilogobius chulae TaxID=88201 RepID=A0AAW0Q1P1_9GOBI